MKNVKRILIFTLIIIALFSITNVCASDVNDATIASDDANQVIEEINDDISEFEDQKDILESADEDIVSMDENSWFYDDIVWYDGSYSEIDQAFLVLADDLENPENITIQLYRDANSQVIFDDENPNEYTIQYSNCKNPIANVDLAILNNYNYEITKLTTDSNGIATYNIPFNVEEFSFCVGFWYDEHHVANYADVDETTIYAFNWGTWHNRNWINGTDKNNTEVNPQNEGSSNDSKTNNTNSNFEIEFNDHLATKDSSLVTVYLNAPLTGRLEIYTNNRKTDSEEFTDGLCRKVTYSSLTGMSTLDLYEFAIFRLSDSGITKDGSYNIKLKFIHENGTAETIAEKQITYKYSPFDIVFNTSEKGLTISYEYYKYNYKVWVNNLTVNIYVNGELNPRFSKIWYEDDEIARFTVHAKDLGIDKSATYKIKTTLIDKSYDENNGEVTLDEREIYVNLQESDGNPSSAETESPAVNKPSQNAKSTPIKKQSTKIIAKNKNYKSKTKVKKYTVTLKTKAGKAIRNVQLTVKINKKTYKAKTNAKGKATFKITKLTKKGTHKALITFKGNKNYNKISKTVKIKIK